MEDKTLPYHGPFIAKELIIAQLERYGFQLETQYQFIPQRMYWSSEKCKLDNLNLL
ncbi:hypothetical protein D3800_00060 [Microcystis aeruginosa NIES-298]|uniref:hypothetical protein n=1 Tax=Microcystis aeruginosa TaxID=1126 RepID=UPI00138C7F06|nr:hypothetical protein [Microcystis aeruginosa]QHU81890.1 hypothetical protein D3800_00060 [Microcystis aeruginosa NIES-298]